MRERTTWNPEDILKRASARAKTAEDPTAMNQDHIQRQPPADKYLTGDPSTFAEDVHPSAKNWKAEYQNGQTARNEIGMPEMRDDTFNHPEVDPGSTPARGGGGRQAALNEETLVKKADLCCKVARQLLGANAVETAVEDQALALMAMSDSALIATVNRMAQQEQGQGQDQQEQKQAKDLPPEFIENMEKKKEEAKDKDDKKAQDQQQGQGQQAQDKQAQMPEFIKEKIEEKKEEEKKDDKEAATSLKANLDQMAQQLQTMAQQIQQMQGQQQQAPMQQQAPQAQQQEQQEQQALDQMLQQQSNDQMIDQMLQQQQGQPQQMIANELGVQLESPSMDIGEVQMTPEDDVLSTLFANNTEVRNAQQAHTLQHGEPAPMQIQASQPMTRTASARTMGTRPTAGVSSIGGLGSPAPSSPSGGDVEKLSSLWNSAPDVSDVFRS